MKVHDQRMQWIIDRTDEFKEAVVAADYIKERRAAPGGTAMTDRALREAKDLAFSFLLVLMGEHIPTTLWSVDDYSVFYGLIFDSEELDITEDR